MYLRHTAYRPGLARPGLSLQPSLNNIPGGAPRATPPDLVEAQAGVVENPCKALLGALLAAHDHDAVVHGGGGQVGLVDALGHDHVGDQDPGIRQHGVADVREDLDAVLVRVVVHDAAEEVCLGALDGLRRPKVVYHGDHARGERLGRLYLLDGLGQVLQDHAVRREGGEGCEDLGDGLALATADVDEGHALAITRGVVQGGEVVEADDRHRVFLRHEAELEGLEALRELRHDRPHGQSVLAVTVRVGIPDRVVGFVDGRLASVLDVLVEVHQRGQALVVPGDVVA